MTRFLVLAAVVLTLGGCGNPAFNQRCAENRFPCQLNPFHQGRVCHDVPGQPRACQ